jgi:hypothetical protein
VLVANTFAEPSRYLMESSVPVQKKTREGGRTQGGRPSTRPALAPTPPATSAVTRPQPPARAPARARSSSTTPAARAPKVPCHCPVSIKEAEKVAGFVERELVESIGQKWRFPVSPKIFNGAYNFFNGFNMYTRSDRHRFFSQNHKLTVIIWFRAFYEHC